MRLSSDDLFQETSARYRAVESEQWLQRYSEAGLSWPSWPKTSYSPPLQEGAPWGMGHHGMGGSQGMAIPGEDLYIGIAINRLTAETRCHQRTLQGYLAHMKTPSRPGPPWDPRNRPTVGS